MFNIILNPYLNYRKKNGVFVLYLDFGYYFFSGVSAEYFNKIIQSKYYKNLKKDVPKSFIDYLKSKRILLEDNVNENE